MTSQIIILQPLVTLIPEDDDIYQPSKLRPTKTISVEEFAYYGQISMRVNFNDDATHESLERDSKEVAAYGRGLDGWYLIADGEQA